MRGLHWTALGVFLGSLGTMIATLPDWHTAMHPAFVGPAFGLLGSFVIALLSGTPEPDTRIGKAASAVQNFVGQQP